MFKKGDFTSRELLHREYGGSRITGIAPSTMSTHVFLFNKDRLPGSGWREDGFYYYAGATNLSTGRWDGGANRAIETAWSRGRRLQLLAAPRAERRPLWRFVDSFVLDGLSEELTTCGPDGSIVHYPVYRLRSIENVTHTPGQMLPPGDPRYVDVRRVERCDLLCRDARENLLENQRPETRLSKAFEHYLMSQGYAVHRLGIRHTAGCAPMLTDTWVAQLSLLIEAKAGTKLTDDVRMAMGQLGHYLRHTPGVLRRAVLLPRHPGRELLEYVRYMGGETIWLSGREWYTTADWNRLIGIRHVPVGWSPSRSDETGRHDRARPSRNNAIDDRLKPASALRLLVEGELLAGELGGHQILGSQGESRYSCPLKPQCVVECSRDVRQSRRVSCGFRKCSRPGGRGPVHVTNRKGKRAGHLSIRSQVPADVNGKAEQCTPTCRFIDLVPVESPFSAGRLGRSMRDHACPVDPTGTFVGKAPHLYAQDPLQRLLRSCRHLPDAVQTVFTQSASGLRADPVQDCYWLWIQEASDPLRSIRDATNSTRQAIMCGHSGKHRVGSHANSAVETVQRRCTYPCQPRQINSVTAEVAYASTHICQCGIGRHRLDDRGDFLQNLKEHSPRFPRRPWRLDVDDGHLNHPALPGLECHSLRPPAESLPAGRRSAQGFISTPLAT